jgi:hypothetical protein
VLDSSFPLKQAHSATLQLDSDTELIRLPGTDETEFCESRGLESKISRSNCQIHWWDEEIKNGKCLRAS